MKAGGRRRVTPSSTDRGSDYSLAAGHRKPSDGRSVDIHVDAAIVGRKDRASQLVDRATSRGKAGVPEKVAWSGRMSHARRMIMPIIRTSPAFLTGAA
jgi:hypothetical protein